MNEPTAQKLHERLAETLTALLAHPETPDRFTKGAGFTIRHIFQVAGWDEGKQAAHRLTLDQAKDFLTVASEFGFAVADALDSDNTNEPLWEDLSEVALNDIPNLIAPVGIMSDSLRLRGVVTAFLDYRRTEEKGWRLRRHKQRAWKARQRSPSPEQQPHAEAIGHCNCARILPLRPSLLKEVHHELIQ
jgi:hypothetical protein